MLKKEKQLYSCMQNTDLVKYAEAETQIQKGELKRLCEQHFVFTSFIPAQLVYLVKFAKQMIMAWLPNV